MSEKIIAIILVKISIEYGYNKYHRETNFKTILS
jgi:hypothetical protein